MGDATQLIHDSMPLCRTLGVRAGSVGAGEVTLLLEWQPELCTAGGVLHGGAIMALADSAGAALAFANLPPDAAGTATIESKTNFLGAVRSGTVTARAVPLHVGRSTIVVETEVRQEDGRLIAKTTQTQSVMFAREGA